MSRLSSQADRAVAMNVPRECFVLETGSGQCVLHVDYAAVARGEEAKAGDEASAPTGSGSGVDFTALTGASQRRAAAVLTAMPCAATLGAGAPSRTCPCCPA